MPDPNPVAYRNTVCSVPDSVITHLVGNEDQSIVPLAKGATQVRYQLWTGKTGHRKLAYSGDSITITAQNYGGVFTGAHFVLTSSCKNTHEISDAAKSKLGELGILFGKNEGKVPMYVCSSHNGWFQRIHQRSFAELHHFQPKYPDDRPRLWRLSLKDNGFGFRDEAFVQMMLETANAQTFTPAGLSPICNWLDVHFHGIQKRKYNMDRQRDFSDPNMRSFYRTTSGVETAGSQYLTLANLWRALEEDFSNPRYLPG